MTLLSALLTVTSIVWIVFEISLVMRDRLQGKGKAGNDRGTLYYNFIAIALGMTVASVINANSKFFFPGRWSDIVFWIGLCIMSVRSWIAHMGRYYPRSIIPYDG